MSEVHPIALKALHDLNRKRIEEIEQWRRDFGKDLHTIIADIAGAKVMIAAILAERADDYTFIEKVNALAINAVQAMNNSNIESQMCAVCEEIAELAHSFATLAR